MKTALVLATCLFATVASAQNTVSVPVEQARAIATNALQAGNAELALGVARSLLQANPDDRTALIIVAAAAPQAGAASEGRKAGARAFALSTTDAQKYEAARLTALAAANEERFTLATFWLRRALTVAPNAAETERTLQDAGRLRRINPWSTTLDFGIVPSNNVNGGADSATLRIGGQEIATNSADALALSGLRVTLGFDTKYRFASSSRYRATVGLKYSGARVILQDDTVDDPDPTSPPDATVTLDAGDFAADVAELSLGYDYAFDTGLLTTTATLGAVAYGGERYYDFRRLALERSFPAGDDILLRFGATREWQDYRSANIDRVDRKSLQAGVTYRLENGDRLSATLGVVQSDGPSPNFTFDQRDLTLGYSFAQPVGPVTVGLSAGIKTLDYPTYLIFGAVPGGREDRVTSYGIDLGFPQSSYAGFVPGVAISGSRSDSNISRFTRDTFSVEFTIKSAF